MNCNRTKHRSSPCTPSASTPRTTTGEKCERDLVGCKKRIWMTFGLLPLGKPSRTRDSTDPGAGSHAWIPHSCPKPAGGATSGVVSLRQARSDGVLQPATRRIAAFAARRGARCFDGSARVWPAGCRGDTFSGSGRGRSTLRPTRTWIRPGPTSLGDSPISAGHWQRDTVRHAAVKNVELLEIYIINRFFY